MEKYKKTWRITKEARFITLPVIHWAVKTAAYINQLKDRLYPSDNV